MTYMRVFSVSDNVISSWTVMLRSLSADCVALESLSALMPDTKMMCYLMLLMLFLTAAL